MSVTGRAHELLRLAENSRNLAKAITKNKLITDFFFTTVNPKDFPVSQPNLRS